MSDIFISYARKDLEKVEPLAKALEAKGWSVWWDPKIRAGTQFDRVIEKALVKTRCVLVVWSKASVDSDWVRAEASYGLKKGILISIAIERDVVPPVRFLNIHTEPLIDWDAKKPSSSFDKIVGDLEAVLGRPEFPEKPQKEYPELDAMVEVPAGEFIYQSSKATIEKPFLIDVYPVTNQQFKEFIGAGGYQKDQYMSGLNFPWQETERVTEPKFWTNEKWNQPEHPVVGVSYYEAEAYAKWIGKRLPTELEWERAAAGTDGRLYPWGNDFDKGRSNTKETGIRKTTEVTRFPNGKSPAGCYDMTGNVWEWTSSLYDEKENFSVLRGGSWFETRISARCANRFEVTLSLRGDSYGFRCAKTLK